MSEPTDYTHLAPAFTALGDQLEAIVNDLADLLAVEQHLSDRLFELLRDAGPDECERAGAETGIRRLTGLCLDAHALLRGWCGPDRAEQERGNDHGRR
jgi:hypothetical protein